MTQKKPPIAPRGDYEVGYGKPPKASQFKLGSSGHKAGRPRAPKKRPATDAEILNMLLSEELEVVVDGVVRTISKRELALRQIVTRAAKGEPAAQRELRNLHKDHAEFGEPAQSEEEKEKTLDEVWRIANALDQGARARSQLEIYIQYYGPLPARAQLKLDAGARSVEHTELLQQIAATEGPFKPYEPNADLPLEQLEMRWPRVSGLERRATGDR